MLGLRKIAVKKRKIQTIRKIPIGWEKDIPKVVINKKLKKKIEKYIETATNGIHPDAHNTMGNKKKNAEMAAKCLFNKSNWQPGKSLPQGENSVIFFLCDDDEKCKKEKYNGYLAKYQKKNTMERNKDLIEREAWIQHTVYKAYEDPITAKIIAPVIKCGEEDEGALIIMQHIKGNTFGDFFKNNFNNQKELLEKFTEVFELINKLHHLNIQHTDLNLNNILMIEDKTKMILIDFGQSQYYSSPLTNEQKEKDYEYFWGNIKDRQQFLNVDNEKYYETLEKLRKIYDSKLSEYKIKFLVGGKKTRKHKGIVQTGGNKGKLRKGYKYTGKKLKNGMAEIKKVKSKK